MKRISATVAAALAAIVAAGPAAPEAQRGASLRLLDRAPLTVRGTSFARRERVRVTATTDHALTRTVRASAAGTFTATFAETRVDRCNAVRVVAIGGNGSRATLKTLPAPACLPE